MVAKEVSSMSSAAEPHPVGLAILSLMALGSLVLAVRAFGVVGVLRFVLAIAFLGVWIAFRSLGAITGTRR